MNNKKKSHIGKTVMGISLSLAVAFSGSMLVSPQPAQAASVSKSSVADNVIAAGKKLIGVPYKFGAKSGNTNVFDCSSFTQYVFNQNGIDIPRSSQEQSKVGTSVSKKDLQSGDLVFSDTNRDGVINHVAIYMGGDKIIHTYRVGIGVTISDFSGSTWDKTYVTARRVISNGGQDGTVTPQPAPTEPEQPAVEAPEEQQKDTSPSRWKQNRQWGWNYWDNNNDDN
ncbi:C40 family peptidase [Paenibacillus profundus]|uniref:C40 family peptidase n=1 Tax=Paenibacillus profundus TaxID=1173085 RepID=UPI002D7FC929|nr:C40 family peptidase [Paenibacillus profundus]